MGKLVRWLEDLSLILIILAGACLAFYIDKAYLDGGFCMKI